MPDTPAAEEEHARGQPRSRWNRYLEALLATDGLTVAEHRLALALMRLIAGYRLDERPLGDRLLRRTARLDGRSFARARTGLVAKGLLRYQHDGRKRTHYALLYPCPPHSGQGVTAPQRSALPAPQRAPVTAPQRARIGTLEKPSREAVLEKKSEATSASTSAPREADDEILF